MSQTFDVAGYLQGKGYHLKPAGGSEHHLACFFHGEDPGDRGRLYVNCDPGAEILGLFECKVCGERGALPTLMRWHGDEVPWKKDDPDENSEARLEILRVATAFYHEALGDHEDVFAYLRGEERMLTAETIMQHQIGYAADEIDQDLGNNTITKRPSRALYRHLRDLGFTTKDILDTGLVTKNRDDKLVDSLSGMITIPYRVAGNVVQIRGRAWPYSKEDKKPKYKTCGGNSSRLFNTDAVWNNTELVVTEGEFDAMVIEQLGWPAVGVPGAKGWQDAWDGYVKDLRRIWLVFDRDAAGEQGAQKITARFPGKVRRIHLSPEGFKVDPTQWVANGNGADEFATLIDEAKKAGLLVTVDQAIAEHAEYQGVPGIQFGVELLDLAISPGLQAGQLAIVLAKTGTGKTIFLLNMMQRMRMVPGQENLKFLFLSLEQTRGEWWERARRIHRFYNLDADDNTAADWWRDQILIVDKNRLTPDQIRQAVDDFDYRMGQLPDVICLDYIGYFAQSFKGERYERTSDAVMGLKEIVKDTRCRMVAPHQVSRMAKDGEEFGTDAARDSGAIEETSDFLFNIWSPDNTLARAEEEKQGIVSQRIAKSRNGSRGLKIDYRWGPLSLVMVPTTDPLARFAQDEMTYNGPGYRDDWATAVWRHRTGIKGAAQRPGMTYAQTEEEF